MDTSPREAEPLVWLAWPLTELDDDEGGLIFGEKVGQRLSSETWVCKHQFKPCDMVTNSRYATARLQLYQVLFHNHLSSYRQNATSGYSRHLFQLPRAHKWVYKVAGETNTLIQSLQIPPA